MDIILIFIVGYIVLILFTIVIIRGIVHRIKRPNDELKEEVSHLKKRIRELESEKDV